MAADKGFEPDKILAFESVPANSPDSRDQDTNAIQVSLQIWMDALGEESNVKKTR